MRGRIVASAWLTGALSAAGGCSSTPVEPASPAWSDVAPIFRGECNSCHGWTAKETGGSYRFDFFDVTADVCGDAALALDRAVILAGATVAANQIKADVVTKSGAQWPRMPPQPSPALPSWERDTIERWTAQPVKGAPPTGNSPPTIDLSAYPATADETVGFTVVLSDPDDDAAVGVIEANGTAFLMNRTGSFAVRFDSSSWPAGAQPIKAVVCDGWNKAEYQLGSVQIAHPADSKTP
jgi:hypothetical protein